MMKDGSMMARDGSEEQLCDVALRSDLRTIKKAENA
jgi:hypothetical protein